MEERYLTIKRWGAITTLTHLCLVYGSQRVEAGHQFSILGLLIWPCLQINYPSKGKIVILSCRKPPRGRNQTLCSNPSRSSLSIGLSSFSSPDSSDLQVTSKNPLSHIIYAIIFSYEIISILVRYLTWKHKHPRVLDLSVRWVAGLEIFAFRKSLSSSFLGIASFNSSD